MSTQELRSSLRLKSLRAKEAKDAREALEAQKVKSVPQPKKRRLSIPEIRRINEAKKVPKAKEAKKVPKAKEAWVTTVDEGYESSVDEDENSRSVRIAALVAKREKKAKNANIALRAKRELELEEDYSDESDDSDEEDEKSRAVKRGVDFFVSAMFDEAGGKRQLRIDHLDKKADMIKASKKKSSRARDQAFYKSWSQRADLDMSDYEGYYCDTCDTDDFGSISNDDEYYGEIYDRHMERQKRKEKGEWDWWM